MSDLVSRQDVLGAMIEQAHISGRYKLGEIWELNLDEIKEAVNRIPSVEKVGEWIKNEHGLKCCSVCGKRPLQICYYDINLDGYDGKDILSKYCPHCGVRMKRRTNEEY